jgi:predicted DNA-binding transcriptional regulator YafY
MVSLLLQLQVRGQLTGPELADRLEVSERTVQRDVEALIAAGVPIQSIRGQAGGYRLDGRYQTRLTGVAADEAHALAFLGLNETAGQLGLGGVLDTAHTKVWAALTGPARERAERTAQRFHLDPVRWYGTSEPTPLLAPLADAVWSDRRILATYVRNGSPRERTLDPLGLVLAAGDWYLVALHDGGRRTYRVSRFSAVEPLPDQVRRPGGFVLAEVWAEARRELETRHQLIEVTIRVASAALPHLRRLVAVPGQTRIALNGESDWVRLTVPFEGEPWAVTCLLGLGSQVEVLAPPALRQRVAAETRAAAARYD